MSPTEHPTSPSALSIAVQQLGDALTLLITQHRLSVAIPERQATVRSLRTLTTQLLAAAVATGAQDLKALRRHLETALATVASNCRPGASAEEQEYLGYCLKELRLTFELADQITAEYHTRPEIARTLIDDLPIFRPFDYGGVATLGSAPQSDADAT